MFIPAILIDRMSFVVCLYDSEKDILLNIKQEITLYQRSFITKWNCPSMGSIAPQVSCL